MAGAAPPHPAPPAPRPQLPSLEEIWWVSGAWVLARVQLGRWREWLKAAGATAGRPASCHHPLLLPTLHPPPAPPSAPCFASFGHVVIPWLRVHCPGAGLGLLWGRAGQLGRPARQLGREQGLWSHEQVCRCGCRNRHGRGLGGQRRLTGGQKRAGRGRANGSGGCARCIHACLPTCRCPRLAPTAAWATLRLRLALPRC